MYYVSALCTDESFSDYTIQVTDLTEAIALAQSFVREDVGAEVTDAATGECLWEQQPLAA